MKTVKIRFDHPHEESFESMIGSDGVRYTTNPGFDHDHDWDWLYGNTHLDTGFLGIAIKLGHGTLTLVDQSDNESRNITIEDIPAYMTDGWKVILRRGNDG